MDEDDDLVLDHLDIKLPEKDRIIIRLVIGPPLQFSGYFELESEDDSNGSKT